MAQKLRVPVGTLLGLIFIALMHPTRRSLWVGGIAAGLGASLRIWAAGYIDKGRVLTRDGPYAFIRHPLYLGSLLMAVGVLIAGQGYWLLVPFAAFYLGVYYPVMRAEERELLEAHGESFKQYVSTVPLFVPLFTRAHGRPSGFLWSRVLRNGEHRTVVGLLLTEIILLMKLMV
jgi:protein-S-isoprenylcysteine O-methyltransferase Ste14